MGRCLNFFTEKGGSKSLSSLKLTHTIQIQTPLLPMDHSTQALPFVSAGDEEGYG